MGRGTGTKAGYTAQSYQNALENGHLLYYLPGWRFQQDNAPIHNALSIQTWLEHHGIWTAKWPALSPDLNFIEHLWFAHNYQVYQLHLATDNMGRSEADLEVVLGAIQKAWAVLPDKLLLKLILSMPDRLATVRRAN